MEHPLILALLSSIVWTATALESEPQKQVVELGTKFMYPCPSPIDGNASDLIGKEIGVKLVTGKRNYTISAHKSQYGTLTFDRVKFSDNGAIFSCSVTSRSGASVRTSVRLIVMAQEDLPRGFPMIDSGVSDSRIRHSEPGDVVRLPCFAHGSPLPNTTWFKDSIPIDRKDKRYSNVTSNDLFIRNVQTEDSGVYECVAHNIHGKAISKPFTLYVQKRPTPISLHASFLILGCVVIFWAVIMVGGMFLLRHYFNARRHNVRALPIVNHPNRRVITTLVTGPPPDYDSVIQMNETVSTTCSMSVSYRHLHH